MPLQTERANPFVERRPLGFEQPPTHRIGPGNR